MLNVLLNLILFSGKFIAGKISGSVSVVADAFNNLADAVTVLLTAVGIKVSSFGAGERHENGHGKLEWIVALITSLSVFVVGWELLRNSIRAIKNSADTVFSLLTLVILFVSIGVKLFLYIINLKKSKSKNLISLKAVALDSLSDAISTTAVLLSLILNRLLGWKLDGVFGLAVAIMIMFNSFKTASESIEKLMSKKASDDEIKALKTFVLSTFTEVREIYDIQIEDYGNNTKHTFFSVIQNDDETMEQFVNAVTYMGRKIQDKFGYTSTIQIENGVCEKEQILIKDRVENLVLQSEIKIKAENIRLINLADNQRMLKMTVYIPMGTYTKKEDVNALFTSSALGLSDNDIIDITIRHSRPLREDNYNHRKRRKMY